MKKEDINILEVMRAEGIEVNRHGKACCPLHGEKTPSLQIYEDTNSYFCWGGCNAGGDSIDFIQKLKGIDFNGACEHLGIDRKSVV